MGDFNLSDALEGSSELDQGFESLCSNMKDVQEEIFRLEEGLDMVVSHNPVTMRCVAKLLLAVNRMKKSRSHCGMEHGDHELCSTIVDSLLDETIVKTTQENISAETRRKEFVRADSGMLCTMCDTSHKDIVHNQVSGELMLLAITLKGGQSERQVNFKLSRYVTAHVSVGDGQTVVLSITKSNYHLSCSMKDGTAVLSVEKCNENDMEKISEDGHMDRFLFFKRTRGLCHTTFESIRCRGWFISTSYEDENKPLKMSEWDAGRCHMNFKLNAKTSLD